MCEVLDEVRLAPLARPARKREPVLAGLREAQFPGVVVASERVAQELMADVWQALRENRLIRRWELVVSDAVTDANVHGVCSPLRMVREGTAEGALVLGRKTLSRGKAAAALGGIQSVDMDTFWIKETDVPALVERLETRDQGMDAVRPAAEGKENCASLRNRAIVDPGSGSKQRQTSKGPVVPKRRSDSAADKQVKGKKPSLRASTRLPRAVVSRGRSTSDDGNNLVSGTDSSTDLRRSSRNSAQAASEGAKHEDAQEEQTGRATTGPIKRREPYNRIAPELLAQKRRPRRRSPRFSPPPSDESSLAPKIAEQPKRPQIPKSESTQKPVAVMHPKVKRDNSRSRSRGSSSASVVLSRTEMTNEDEGNTTSSRANREKVQKRARALRIYDTSSGEETFYTPPSHPLPPRSSSSSPDKYYTPRASLSPKAVTDSSKSRKNSFPKMVSRKGSSSRQHEGERAKSTSRRLVPPKAKASPLKSDASRTIARLDVTDSDSSDDEPLSTKFANIRKERSKGRSKTYTSPALTRKKAAVQPTSESPKRKQAVKSRSVFEGLVPRNFEPSQKSDGVARRHSFSGPVRVKHEADLVSRERPPGIPRYSVTDAKKRRKSFHNTIRREDDIFNRDAPLGEGMPRYGNSSKHSRRSPLPSTSSVLPLKRPPLEIRTTHAVRRSLSRDTTSVSSARRASLNESRRRSTPAHKAKNRLLASLGSRSRSESRIPSRSPVRNTRPQQSVRNVGLASKAHRSRSELGVPSKSPVRNTTPTMSPNQDEVIVIMSDSEEETIRNLTPTKRRRLFATADNRGGTRRNDTGAGGSGRRIQGHNIESGRGTRKNKRGAGTSKRKVQSQNKRDTRDRSQNNSSPSHALQDKDLGTFIRNINRRGKLSQLTGLQRKRYDEHLDRATRYRKAGRQKEAIESYERCLEIYDGDPELTNWLLALSSKQGYLRTSDFLSQTSRSPIKKQSRRRRKPSRTALGERSSSRLEVIDLTSS